MSAQDIERIIYLRNISPLLHADKIVRALDSFASELETGAMIVIGRSGMRARRSAFSEDP